ncbi:quinone oxidoreductase family protein [Pseudoxanthomonas japonensis]|nr:zinc-binding alcohol dehydrogenase family protein [Pseudoxanthomonas japonensis]
MAVYIARTNDLLEEIPAMYPEQRPMKAAVVTTFGTSPSFQEFRDPEAGEGREVVAVRAAAISPIVRLLAAGKHYTSGENAGFVPGIDGVGIDGTGRRVYFLFPASPFGSLAEKSLVASEMMVPVPEALPDNLAAAIATAGLASWIALTRRAGLQSGEKVMVLGATGSAGGMAVQIARHLGASTVIAVGRDAAKLERVDADVRIPLDNGAEAALRAQFEKGVDVVLDFVWGEPAVRVLKAATHNRAARTGEPRMRYVQIGTSAGDEVPLRGDMLRSSGLELIGSGIGSVSVSDFMAGAAELLAAASAAGFDTPFNSVPLHSIADAWHGDTDTRYIVTSAT